MDTEIVKYWQVPKGVPCIYLYLEERYEGGGYATEMWRKPYVEDVDGARRTMVVVEFAHRGGTFGYWEDDLKRITFDRYTAATMENERDPKQLDAAIYSGNPSAVQAVTWEGLPPHRQGVLTSASKRSLFPFTEGELAVYEGLVSVGLLAEYDGEYTLTEAGRALLPAGEVGETFDNMDLRTAAEFYKEQYSVCNTGYAQVNAEHQLLKKFYDIVTSCDVHNDLRASLQDEDVETWAEFDILCDKLRKLFPVD